MIHAIYIYDMKCINDHNQTFANKYYTGYNYIIIIFK